MQSEAHKIHIDSGRTCSNPEELALCQMSLGTATGASETESGTVTGELLLSCSSSLVLAVRHRFQKL